MNRNTPLVSIVIPVYNAAAFLAETIESTLQQTYQNIEIILVDDGSRDASFEIAQRYAGEKVKIIRQKNSGASAARNHGVSLAQGDYIQYLDADDFLHPQKIEQQLSTLQHYSDLHLIGGTWQRFVNNLDTMVGPVWPVTEKELESFNHADWLIKRPMMIPNTWLVSKKLVTLAGPWDEQISVNDDGEYFYRVIAVATGGVVIDRKAATYYRSFTTTSLSSRDDRNAMLSWIKSVRSYKAIVKTVAGDKGNDSVDEFFYKLSYSCLNRFPDLLQICRAEMYHPNKKYIIEDKLVFHLSKLIGLSKAKKSRELILSFKKIRAIKKTIKIIKLSLGKSAY